MRELMLSFVLCLVVALLNACSGGGASTADTPTYALTPKSLPISATDKLVTVTVSATNATFASNRNQSILATILDFLVSSANAALNPTLSVLATAKIINGAVEKVDPVFTTQVPDPSVTPTANNPHPSKSVSVVCDTDSIPTTVQVNSVWALNKATGDMMVNMKYPSSVQAKYDQVTEKFSSCSFVYSSGNFIVYGDQTVGDTIDPLVGGEKQTGACAMNDGAFFWIVANGDPSRNTSNFPIILDLHDSSYFDGDTNTYVKGPMCGSARTISYGKGIATVITKISFNNPTLANSGSFAADTSNIYAVGSEPDYGGYAVKINCPVSVVKISDGSTSCVSIPSISNYVDYPVPPSQAGSANNLKKPYPSIFINSDANIILSLQQFNQCSVWGCSNVGAVSPPILYSIAPASLTASELSPDTSQYPNTTYLTPVGASNGFLTLADSGGGLVNGVLWNMNTGQILHTCTVDPVFGAGCPDYHWVYGDYVYGMRQCAYNSSTPNACLGTPSIGRVNTKTGVAQHWDPFALGWLPQLQQSVPVLWFANQVTFFACRAPTSTCIDPSWVTLDFSSGTITMADSSMTANLAQTLVQASF